MLASKKGYYYFVNTEAEKSKHSKKDDVQIYSSSSKTNCHSQIQFQPLQIPAYRNAQCSYCCSMCLCVLECANCNKSAEVVINIDFEIVC